MRAIGATESAATAPLTARLSPTKLSIESGAMNMRNRAFYATCALAVVLSSCDKKVDTSSPQAFSSSIAKMEEGMTDAKRAQFHDAIAALALNTADPATGLFAGAPADAPIFMAAGDKIKGKTADDIIRLGYQTRINLLDQDIAKDAAQIQATQAERAKNAAVFDNIIINAARYYVDNSNQFMAQPTIAFHIANRTKMPIKTLYMHGTLSSPGRAIPWISDDFNYTFEGGLEPGEEQSLDLAPNSFGEWAPKDTFAHRPDLVMKIDVSNVEGADGQKLIADEDNDPKALQEDATAKQKTRNQLASEMAKL